MSKSKNKVAAKKVASVKKCAVCGKKFSPNVANAVVCSDKCYKKRKAELDKKRKAAKKSAKPIVKKPILKEKIVLPKKPTKVSKLHPDTIVSVKNGNPFKVFVLATIIRERAMQEIIRTGKIVIK